MDTFNKIHPNTTTNAPVLALGAQGPMSPMSENTDREARPMDDATLAAVTAHCFVSETRRRGAADKCFTEHFDPLAYWATMERTYQNFRENFGQASVREEFLKEQSKSMDKYKSIVLTICNQKGRVDLKSALGAEKFDKESKIYLYGSSVSVLRPAKKHVFEVQDIASVLETNAVEQLSLDYELRGFTLKVSETIGNLERLVGERIEDTVVDRKSATVKLAVAGMLFALAHNTTSELHHLIGKNEPIQDQTYGGGYLSSHIHHEDVSYRLTTLIPRDAISVSLDTSYGLSLRQVNNLFMSIFHMDKLVRVNARIELLGSVKSAVRSEIVTEPGVTLKRVIGECYFNRSELLKFVFSLKTDNSASNKCIACNWQVVMTDYEVNHNSCSLCEWLQTEFQFERTDTGMRIPSLIYVSAGMARYVKHLMHKRHSLMHDTFVGKSMSEFVAYSTNNEGRPYKVMSQGVKPVYVTTRKET